MGVPTIAAYMICATVLSPALMLLVPMMQAHLFRFILPYFSPTLVGIGLVACKCEGDTQGAREVLSFCLPTFSSHSFMTCPVNLYAVW
jgi:hypothetical protein